MKSVNDYINESIIYEKQCNEYLGNKFDNRIDEGIFDWLKKFMAKTTNFLKVWKKKGGKKVTVNAKGMQQTQKPITDKVDKFKQEFNSSSEWKDAFPNTIKYLNQHSHLRPEKIDKTDWDTITENFSVYTPEVHYTNESYPAAVCFYTDKLQLVDNYFHIHHFEPSSLIEGMSNKELFEIVVDFLFNNKKYEGVTMTSKTQPKNLHYKMASHWESTDVSENVWKLTIR